VLCDHVSMGPCLSVTMSVCDHVCLSSCQYVSVCVQALAREAKELARQRAQLEAQLAAERGTAQGHGYSPTPLVTPKAAKVTLIMILEQMLNRVLRVLLLKPRHC